MRIALAFTAALLSSWAVQAASLAEQYVTTAARAANEGYAKALPNDGVTKSARAFAEGNTLVHEHVLAIRRDVTAEQLAAWRAATRGEVVPSTCAHFKNDEFFNTRDVRVRYRYVDRESRVLDDFTVGKSTCAR
ncbi:hypothetical protein [Variovorax sp.]|jgi:hypothetical protein|uniref:hypothetical protein n=1 Tax=Variovorax sp. TaxID=1871043 RepID=UPI0037D9AEDD